MERELNFALHIVIFQFPCKTFFPIVTEADDRSAINVMHFPSKPAFFKISIIFDTLSKAFWCSVTHPYIVQFMSLLLSNITWIE